MPNEKLRANQIIITGANELATFVVPNGCTRNRRIKTAQEMPTIAADGKSGFATLIPST
jgi:hypothetical protein